MSFNISSSSSSTGIFMPQTVSDSCPPVRFLVPLFNSGNSTTSSYHTASDAAHIILGLFLLCMVLSWACFVMDMIRVQAASRWSGLFQTCMGVYLFSWCFYLMHPEGPITELWAYTTTDLLQLQHLSIASLLCAGGIIELLQSALLLPPMSLARSPSTSSAAGASSVHQGSHWHVLWSINLMLTGLVFMLHPQHTYGAAVKHLLLGMALIIGAPLFIRAKSLAWKYELDLIRRGMSESTEITQKGNHVDWSIIAAGGSFAIAACILLAFREQETEVHMGTERTCQPSFITCALSYFTSSTSTTVAVIVSIRQYLTNKRQQQSSPPDTHGCCSSLVQRWRGGWTAISSQTSSSSISPDEDENMVSLDEIHTHHMKNGRTITPRIQTTQVQTNGGERLQNGFISSSHRTPNSTYASSHHASQLTHDLRTAYSLPSSFVNPHHIAATSSTSVSTHTLGDLDEYDDRGVGGDSFAHEYGVDEDAARELERDRRRETDYTGEEEGEEER